MSKFVTTLKRNLVGGTITDLYLEDDGGVSAHDPFIVLKVEKAGRTFLAEVCTDEEQNHAGYLSVREVKIRKSESSP